MLDLDELQSVFHLAKSGPVPLATTHLGAGDLAELGFVILDDQVLLPSNLDLLSEPAIRSHLVTRAGQWLQNVHIFPFIGSTNTWLMEQGASVEGQVCLAECQVSGRGRRGRSWASPLQPTSPCLLA